MSYPIPFKTHYKSISSFISLIIFSILTLLIFSNCSKKDDNVLSSKNSQNTPDKITNTSSAMGIPDIHDESYESPVPNKTTEIECDVSDIPNLSVSMFNDMLHFNDRQELETIVDAMDFQCDDAIDEWVSNFSGFQSLKIMHDNYLANNPSVDPSEYWYEMRIKDMQIEAILNADRKVRIADTVFETSSDFQTISKYLVDDQDINEEPFFFGSASSGDGCSPGHEYNYDPLPILSPMTGYPAWCSSYYSTSWYCRLRTRKYVTANYFRSKISITIWYDKFNGIERNAANFPSHLPAPHLTAYIDEFNQLVYYIPSENTSPSNPKIITNEPFYGSTNKTTAEFRIDRKWWNSICVMEFGRTHNWAGPNKLQLKLDFLYGNLGSNSFFLQDVHHDIW